MAVPSLRVRQWALQHVAHHMQANVAKMLQRVWDKGDIYKDRYSGAQVLQLAFSAYGCTD